MNATMFDGWTRRLHSRHSRRTVVPVLVGLGVGLGVTRPSGAAPTPAKKGHKSTRSTFGCTKHDNTCTAVDDVPCPAPPIGLQGFCVNDNKGKPFCADSGECTPCKKTSDCAAAGPGAICVKKCPTCRAEGFKSACIVPLTTVG